MEDNVIIIPKYRIERNINNHIFMENLKNSTKYKSRVDLVKFDLESSFRVIFDILFKNWNFDINITGNKFDGYYININEYKMYINYNTTRNIDITNWLCEILPKVCSNIKILALSKKQLKKMN